MTKDTIYLNKATVSSSDRSFFYGDGCFTTIACRNNRIELIDRHLSRLRNDCEKIGIHWQGWDNLEQQLSALANDLSTDQVIKVLISRGEGGRGYAPPMQENPVAYISTHPLPDRQLPMSVALGIAETELIEHPRLAGVKHNNRLIQVLAKQELAQLQSEGSQIDDLLLCNASSEIIEATSANFFYMINNKWYTPYVNSEGVAGVMREYVLEMLNTTGQNVSKKNLSFDALPQVQCAFLTNAVTRVLPVNAIAAGTQRYHLNMALSKHIQKTVIDTLQEHH